MKSIDFKMPTIEHKDKKSYEEILSRLKEAAVTLKGKNGKWQSEQFKDAGRTMLGWVTLTEWMKNQTPAMKEFAESVRWEKRSGETTDIVYIGQGGSIECIKTYYGIYGSDKDSPENHILDTVDPEVISGLLDDLDFEKTRFIVITKSLTTLEILSLYKLFFSRLVKISGDREKAAGRVTLITNEDRTPEEIKNNPKYKDVAKRGYSNVFYIEPNTGGRYSWDTPVMLIAAGIMNGPGEIDSLTKDAKLIEKASLAGDVKKNPALAYAAYKLLMQKKRKNQCTLLLPDGFKPYGPWAGQLDVESLGKCEDVSSLMIDHETLADDVSLYGKKRFFVRIKADAKDDSLDGYSRKLRESGFPVADIILPGKENLGQLFKMSEFATLFTGYAMGVNPVNQPGVEEYKKNQKALVKEKEAEPDKNIIEEDGIILDYNDCLGKGKIPPRELEAVIEGLGSKNLAAVYAAIMYLASDRCGKDAFVNVIFKRLDAELSDIQEFWRINVRGILKAATLGEEAPCILHAKQQGFQQGENCCFFTIVRILGFKKDIEVPDTDYTFGKLIRAQGSAMLKALSGAGRIGVKIDLKDSSRKTIDAFGDKIKKSIDILKTLA
jgi:glucose-6-phosphate isomerase